MYVSLMVTREVRDGLFLQRKKDIKNGTKDVVLIEDPDFRLYLVKSVTMRIYTPDIVYMNHGDIDQRKRMV